MGKDHRPVVGSVTTSSDESTKAAADFAAVRNGFRIELGRRCHANGCASEVLRRTRSAVSDPLYDCFESLSCFMQVVSGRGFTAVN